MPQGTGFQSLQSGPAKIVGFFAVMLFHGVEEAYPAAHLFKNGEAHLFQTSFECVEGFSHPRQPYDDRFCQFLLQPAQMAKHTAVTVS